MIPLVHVGKWWNGSVEESRERGIQLAELGQRKRAYKAETTWQENGAMVCQCCCEVGLGK